MRVYGDRERSTTVQSALDALVQGVAEARGAPPGLARHSRLVELLIEAAALHQGISDLELARLGVDEETIVQAAGREVLLGLAQAVAASWDDPAGALTLRLDDALARWRDAAPAQPVTLRVAEGFAHYAVYPEAYLEAARSVSWSAPPCVIGLRSIGAALAPMVAAAVGDDAMVATPRPVGEPFARRLALGAGLQARLMNHGGPYVVVDEGPGLSGSSFGAVGDLLESAAVAAEQIVYMPSHAGGPGLMASLPYRQRWMAARRQVGDFDSRIGPGRLTAWVNDTVGATRGALRDLSGGAWRLTVGSDAPVIPMLERRKFLAETDSGSWLLKFAGLGADGRAKAERARVLAAAGFSPPVAGWAHGFLALSWISEGRPLELRRYDHVRLLDRLTSYLAFRTACLPARAESGADLRALAEMAKINASEALGAEFGAEVERRLQALLADPPVNRPVHVDGRLHAWEWLETAAGDLLKVDAVDHACGHDLVGCQDIAWDVAGAELELELSAPETNRLARVLGVDPRLLAVHRACYPAFQLGLWSLAPADEASRVEAHVRRYRGALRRFAGQTSGDDPWMEARRRAT
jgi:hypothetical protein